MGSALTVLLSISRIMSLILLLIILIKQFYNVDMSVILVFSIIVIMSLRTAQFDKIQNYWESPLPPSLEIALVYLLLFIMYKSDTYKYNYDYGLGNMMNPILAITILYTLCVIYSFFPPVGEFDRMAANRYWSSK